MALVDQWRQLEAELPADWPEVRLSLTVSDPARSSRAAALLGPTTPGRGGGSKLFFACSRSGGDVGPEALRRLLGRLDGEGIRGALELVSTGATPVADVVAGGSLVRAWKTARVALPGDWSDLLVEVGLDSSDYLDRGALAMAPLNPSRVPGRSAFRFRCARRFGYGASEPMVSRCLARCDEAGMTGRITVLRALSDTHPVGTQGPVWYVGGRAV
ncbi:MAG: hypothetical protein ACR2MU_00815 [Gaiellaceae bacterium]